MRRLVIDIEDETYTDLDILSGGIRSLRDKMILNLVQAELEKQRYVIARLKDVEKRKQQHIELLKAQYETENKKDNIINNGEKNDSSK